MTKSTAKLPWFKFFPADWINDPSLSMCSAPTRGIWIDLLCAMHQSGRSGELRGTTEQIARLARTSTAELTHALTDLQSTGTADVTFRNKDVTVINRKMKREAKDRAAAALRVKKHRSNAVCNGGVTPEKTEVRRQKTDNTLFKRKDGGDFHQTPGPECDVILTEMEMSGTVEFLVHLRKGTITIARVNDFWSAFKLNLTGQEFYNSRAHLVKHFRNWLKTQDLSAKEVPKEASAPVRNLIEEKTLSILNGSNR